jgi:hypothetical protein
LAKVFEQDTFNMGRLQQGLRSASHEFVTLASYQETKLRHFHALLEQAISR